MTNFITKRICTLFLCVFALLFLPNITYGEQKIIEADGIYVVSIQEDVEKLFAQKKAKQDALRNAVEQAGVFVNSISTLNNLVLTSDEIETVAAGNVKVLNENYENHIEDNGATIVYKCKIRVLADVDLFKLQKILDYRKTDKSNPFIFITDDLKQLYKNKAGKSVWISPRSIMWHDGITSFNVVLMSDTTDECIVFEGEIKSSEKLYQLKDAKIYDAKTGKLIRSFPAPLYKWQPYARESLYGSVDYYINQRNTDIGNDIILNNYDMTKNQALAFLAHHMKTKNLYFQDVLYTRFTPGIDSITVTYLLPDTVEKINDNIVKFKKINVRYNSHSNVAKSLKLLEDDCTQYDIENWELNKKEKMFYLKHYKRFTPSHQIIQEGDSSYTSKFVEDPWPDEAVMFHSLKNFYDKFIK